MMSFSRSSMEWSEGGSIPRGSAGAIAHHHRRSSARINYLAWDRGAMGSSPVRSLITLFGAFRHGGILAGFFAIGRT